MIFDLFHSIGDPKVGGRQLGANGSYRAFFEQVELAEALGFDTVWCAESHFSSETQKATSVATIPEFFGEVGLNCDSFQLFHVLQARTKRISFGTAIHNIVGGSGGPIASADRVNFLRYCNANLWHEPRHLKIGVAAGRFPYQNTPFGIVARDPAEAKVWGLVKRYVFLEALEIFLRLINGETLSSKAITQFFISEEEARAATKGHLPEGAGFPHYVKPRWDFESLTLVPQLEKTAPFSIVLGSSDPEALKLARQFFDVDLFNLSFTPPEQIEKLHAQMSAASATWNRSRLPRTVMVFMDPDRKKARALANFVLDAYIEAMKGTAQVPDKAVLMERALIGDAAEVRDQLHPENPRRFNPNDRLMLWFEFNQLDDSQIQSQMKYFWKEIGEKLA